MNQTGHQYATFRSIMRPLLQMVVCTGIVDLHSCVVYWHHCSNTTHKVPTVRKTNSLSMQNFARRLHAALTKSGMSQSDLARAVWGRGIDPRGYNVAKNRDRIVHYLRGRALPSSDTLQKMAEALGMDPDELLPPAAAIIDAENPSFSITVVGDKALLTVNKLVPLDVALQVGTLLGGSG
jgi:transcriptional regulator with XRE-family HTH domain